MLERALDLVQSGNPLLGLSTVRTLRSYGNQDKEWAQRIAQEISKQALLQAIPQAYRLKKVPKSTEKLIANSAKKMKTNGEWLQLWEFLKIANGNFDQRSSHNSLLPGLDNDIKAIEKFLYAQRLEEAGQLSQALGAYNSVLVLTGPYGPYLEAQKAVENLRTNKADKLLADQKREASIPRKAPSYTDSRMRRYNPASRADTQRLEKQIEKILEEKLATYLAHQKEKETKASAPSEEETTSEKKSP